MPVGELTYVFTDVPESGVLWEEAPTATAMAMARHDEIVERIVVRRKGRMVRPRGEGDSRFAVFHHPVDGVIACVEMVQALAAEPWPTPRPISIRAAIHCGESELRAGDYYGSAVNRTARLRATGHPGQVLVSQAAASLAERQLPHGVELRDLGMHALRDLSEPEHVFDLVIAGLTGEFPPLQSLDRARHNLPHQLDEFIGRDVELLDLAAALRVSRVVSIVGPPGVGKTRLALQVAGELVENYQDGAWLVELAGMADRDEVLGALATGVGLRSKGPATVERVEQFLTPKTTLLVLDGSDGASSTIAALILRLQKAAPGVHVLATSTTALGVVGEQTYPLGGLAYPDPTDALPADALRTFDAVRLLVDRVQALRPSFLLDVENAAAIAELCARLEGVPAALERTATRLRALSPAQLLERLAGPDVPSTGSVAGR